MNSPAIADVRCTSTPTVIGQRTDEGSINRKMSRMSPLHAAETLHSPVSDGSLDMPLHFQNCSGHARFTFKDPNSFQLQAQDHPVMVRPRELNAPKLRYSTGASALGTSRYNVHSHSRSWRNWLRCLSRNLPPRLPCDILNAIHSQL